MAVEFPPLDDSFPRIVPPFRKLVKIMSECVAGGVSLNCSAFEYRQCDQALGTLLGSFMEVVRLKELPSEQVESINEILLLFSKISVQMLTLEGALGSDNSKVSSECISKIYDYLKELEELNMDLKAAVGDRHLYSEVPVVDSLLRAGHFVLETNGEWDALSARLQALIPDWNEIVAGEGLPEEFAKHDQALDKLVSVVNDQDLKALPQVLEEVKQTGEALTGFDDSQVVDEDSSTVLCPFCGKPMMSGSTKCFACGARIPEVFDANSSHTGEEGAGGVLPEDMPDYIQRLFDVAQDLPNNPKLFRPFRRAVGELRRRVAGSLSKMEKITASKVRMTPEVRENVDGVCDLAGAGLDKFMKALELLEGFEPPVDRFHLQCALEVVASAVEEMRGVGGLAQKYRNT